MHRRLRQAYTALREHGSVSYAKVAAISGFCDLDFIVIKATAPDEVPLPEKYVQELLKILSLSPSSSKAFALSFSRRFGKTQSWRVALKCLALLHRLLHSLPECTSFRSDILRFRSNGLLSLHPCHFRDTSSSPSISHDLTLFIQSYAHLLDEALNCFSFYFSNDKTEETEPPDSLSEKMKEIGRILNLLPELQSLIDRAIDCHPTGVAVRNLIVRSAMKQILRDSFECYATFRRDIVVLLDNLFQMQYRSSISALKIYKKAATQASRLNEFYESCKGMGLCGLYEYPFVDKIPHIQIRALESFLNEMWQLTESSSSSSSSLSTTPPSSMSESEDGTERHLKRLQSVISMDWNTFEEGNEGEDEKPLIQLEVNDASWEELLEATAWCPRNLMLHNPFLCDYGYGYRNKHRCILLKDKNETDDRRVQVYDPSPNPFSPSTCYGYNTPGYYEVATMYNYTPTSGL
ncbi:hypothetical protein AAC387_Pa03g1691 [Persea americana]